MSALADQCRNCEMPLPPSRSHRIWCSGKCKARYRKLHGGKTDDLLGGHHCRECDNWFAIEPGQGNKWLCSEDCRKTRNARSAREFHLRRPQAEAIYRARSKTRGSPDGRMVRFHRWHPEAPRACESCGDNRVLDVAHKPAHQRFGARQSKENCSWPQKVWVLCPTCHALLDRMNFTPQELGLVE